MNDFKMNPPGVSERIQTLGYTAGDKCKEFRESLAIGEIAVFQNPESAEVRRQTTKYDKQAKGLEL